ncbi:MAG: Transcriptional regulator, PadR family, partial [uncultured Thermomicrobiales bacterium]
VCAALRWQLVRPQGAPRRARRPVRLPPARRKREAAPRAPRPLAWPRRRRTGAARRRPGGDPGAAGRTADAWLRDDPGVAGPDTRRLATQPRLGLPGPAAARERRADSWPGVQRQTAVRANRGRSRRARTRRAGAYALGGGRRRSLAQPGATARRDRPDHRGGRPGRLGGQRCAEGAGGRGARRDPSTPLHDSGRGLL